MMSFRGTRLQDLRLPQGTVWMLEALAEAKGRQQLCEHPSPQLLESLRELALGIADAPGLLPKVEGRGKFVQARGVA